MKKLVQKISPVNEITVDQLTGNEIVAYKQHGSNNLSVLAEFTEGEGVLKRNVFGFIPLNRTGRPTYLSVSFYSSIADAMSNRQVYTFEDQKDLAKFILYEKV